MQTTITLSLMARELYYALLAAGVASCVAGMVLPLLQTLGKRSSNELAEH
jgi:hypothetical protein